ncbi:DUF4760 domain-containing protein [Pseudoalteromonas sp. NC201]|uniref:DUF4760 domain-containing protein n=1 Tax=Pseudoalteromonas sp. NC201 TaxID=1514074 RepID=UPI000C7A7E65|nr:hypothetical protein [Pseudoalteromonas sp. NC201]AUJ70047.1 hypothetical protein PNC201_08765 [Pseudoalteromonas sp. NC201]
MTIADFFKDMVPILSLVIGVIGIILVTRQVYFARIALEQAAHWNKIHATYSTFDVSAQTELELVAKSYAKNKLNLDIGAHYILTESDAKKIFGDDECLLLFTRYLNTLEGSCAAYQFGAADRELSYHLNGGRVPHKYDTYKTLIDLYREERGNPTILIEIEKTAIEWKERLAEELNEMETNKEHFLKAAVKKLGAKISV